MVAIGRYPGGGGSSGEEGKGMDDVRGKVFESEMGGGKGRCSREAASFSPGDSNATAGNPYVAPNKLASAPPKECPTSQTLADGYISMRSSMRFWKYQPESEREKQKHK